MKRKLYSAAVILFCLVSVILAVLDLRRGLTPAERWADRIIYVLFVADYLIRLILADDKRAFLKENILDLIAIIPFSALFRVFRLARFARAFRLLRILRVAAVSARALISRPFPPPKPHFMGNTCCSPVRLEARTGRTADGKISPSAVSISSGRFLNRSASLERFISFTSSRSSGLAGAIYTLPHMSLSLSSVFRLILSRSQSAYHFRPLP